MSSFSDTSLRAAPARPRPSQVPGELAMVVQPVSSRVEVDDRRWVVARLEELGALPPGPMQHVAAATEPLGTVELGARLGIRSASATALVDRLVAAGHLTRTPHPDDRRRVALVATDHARAEVRRGLAPLLDQVAAITARLDDDEAAAVLRFLDDVAAAMRDYPSSPTEAAGQP